eukprot:5124849-Pleurochrysis_carterae.AAC.1
MPLALVGSVRGVRWWVSCRRRRVLVPCVPYRWYVRGRWHEARRVDARKARCMAESVAVAVSDPRIAMR